MMISITNFRLRAILTSKERYLVGLQQLDSAAQQVAIMQAKLEQLEPQLKVAAENVAIQVTQVQGAFDVAEVQRQNVKKDETLAMEEASNASEIAENCTAIMSDALPLIQEAESALNTLSSGDIAILKTFKSPPAAIKIVGEAICILKEAKPEKVPNPSKYYNSSGRFQSINGFFSQMVRVLSKITSQHLRNYWAI